MRGWRGRFFSPLLLIWALAFCQTVGAGDQDRPEIGLTARFIPDPAPVGSMVELSLTYRLPEGATLPPEPVVNGLDGLAVEEVRKQKGEIRIRLLVDRLSKFETGPLSLGYLTKDGNTRFLHADPIAVTVQSNLGERPEEAQPKPICGIIPTRLGLGKILLWVMGAAGLFAAGLLWFLWSRRRRIRGGSQADRVLPHIRAEKAIQDLAAQQIFEKGQIKEFYFRFSEILRRYLESLRGFPAAEYTTQEIALAVASPEDREIVSLLQDTDLVKFADLKPTVARKRDQVEQALAYVRQTGSSFQTDHADNAASNPHSGFIRRRAVQEREAG